MPTPPDLPIDRNYVALNDREKAQLTRILERVAAGYSDDPGTADLSQDQHVTVVLDLELSDIRLIRQLLR